jgi:hypothetical protein
MNPRHFRWVPHVLTPKLREQRVNGLRAPLDVLHPQEKIHFSDIITGDESWILIDAARRSIWLSLDEKLLTCPRPTISADKHMLVVFWQIKGIVHVNWLPKNARINAASLRDEKLAPIFQKLQQHASDGCKPCTRVQRDRAKIHTGTAVSTLMADLRLKRTLEPLPVQTSGHRTSFFLVGSKGSCSNDSSPMQVNFLMFLMKCSRHSRWTQSRTCFATGFIGWNK